MKKVTKKPSAMAKHIHASFIYKLRFLLFGGNRGENKAAMVVAGVMAIFPAIAWLGSHKFVPMLGTKFVESQGWMAVGYAAWMTIMASIVTCGILFSLGNIASAVKQMGYTQRMAWSLALLIEGIMVFSQGSTLATSTSVAALAVVIFLNWVKMSYALITTKKEQTASME